MIPPYAEAMDRMAAADTGFFFAVDFEESAPVVCPLSAVDASSVLYDFDGFTNTKPTQPTPGCIPGISAQPPGLADYSKAFKLVQGHLTDGNSWLVNLTAASLLTVTLDLRELFNQIRSPFRLWMKDRFLCFSPERFITIDKGLITTRPMKGTVSDAVPGAPQVLLKDPKELAEHVTVVDLLRNDLAMVADNVKVENFRYVEKITASTGGLYQTSSEITGTVKNIYRDKPGSLLSVLLPAGSVTGAPKKRTVEIIKEAEGMPRGFYTGIAGYYHKGRLESWVLIRFIEQRNGRQFYRSGGGITIYSDREKEYRELVEKIYVPFC